MPFDKLFEGTELSEEAKEQIVTVFEAKVSEKVDEKTQTLQEELDSIRESQEEQVQEYLEYAKNEMAQKLDSFLNYAVNEWAVENKEAIESDTKVEIAEAFTAGIKKVLAENNIELSDEESSITKKLQEEVSSLKSKLNESLDKQINTHKEYVELKKEVIVSDVCEDLADSQIEKIFKLSEEIDYKDEDSYTQKIKTLKENYFPSETDKKDDGEDGLNENVDTSKKDNKPVTNRWSALTERALSSL